MGKVKDSQFYNDLCVLNSFEMNIGENHYDVFIWADSMEIWKNGECVLEDSPITIYKEGEEILKLDIEIPSTLKKIRKISESFDDWYIQLMLSRNNEGVIVLRRSYFQNDGEKEKNWTESEVVEMPISEALTLYKMIMLEIENTDLDI